MEVGGGLRTYRAGGRELLDGYEADERCPSGRGQVLIPWPNRLEDGSYEFGGQRHQAPLDELEARNAIHGLVRWAGWSVGEREASRVVMEHLLHPRPGYPFSLAIAIEYALSDDGLSVTTTATNVGPDPCPYGCGAHPYLTLGTPTVDSLVLTAPARAVLSSDERGLPTGRSAVAGTEYDFTGSRAIGATRLDHCFTDLERDGGRARVELRSPDGSGLDRLDGRELRVRDAVHGRPAPRRRPPQHRGRADDLPAERVPDGRGSDPARGGPLVHEHVGDHAYAPPVTELIPLAAAADDLDAGSLVLVLAAASAGAILSRLYSRVILPTVVLEGVTARYAPGAQPALCGFDLMLEPGARIALVGPSGAGKTTVTNLLLRFLDPEVGRVTLGGRDVRELRQHDVRRAFALAGQSAYVFNSTIRANLTLARPDATDAELEHALRRARIGEWVASLPDGLDTLVGEEGAQLSGGQRQRLTVARALLSDAPVLVLDEPTAHLDAETAEVLVRDILEAADDRSVLLITHRPEGLDLVDEVVELSLSR